jgi:peptidoglycan/LPS O-acetylase OafA/YrhL
MDNISSTAPGSNIERIHYLDQVRALAMIIGVLVHACYPYSYGVQENWVLRDKTSSLAITLGFFFVHIFRMTVFFFIAGFFGNYLVQKRGVKGFIKNRLARIGLPFIIFWPLALVGAGGLQVLAILYLPQENLSKSSRQAAESVKAAFGQMKTLKTGVAAKPNNDTPPSDAAAKVRDIDSGVTANSRPGKPAPVSAEAQKTAAPAGTQTNQGASLITIHFWFLYNLIWFCLLAALLQRLNYRFIDAIFNKFFSSSIYLWILPLLLVPAILTAGVPTQPPGNIIPQIWSFGYYGVFFLIGWQFFYHRDYLDRIEKHLGLFAAFSLVASAFYLYLSPITKSYMHSLSSEAALAGMGATQFSEKIVLVLLVAYLSVFLTIVSLILGKRFLNYDSRFMRYVSDSSYWIYIIHYPLVTFIQVFFGPLAISGYIKYFASSALVFGIGLFTYRYMVRYTFIGTMLNGKKIKPKIDPPSAGVLAAN